MSQQFIKVWLVTASGYFLVQAGMVCIRLIGFDLYDPRTGLGVTLFADLGATLLFALLIGLTSAPLALNWQTIPGRRQVRSGTFAVGLTAGIFGIYLMDLFGELTGLGLTIGFVVLVHTLDATYPLIIRGLAMIVLVLIVHTFFQTNTYKIFRARHTIRFIETNLAHLEARGEPIPATVEDLQQRFTREARLHGILSVQQDPWRYNYHYVVDPDDGSHIYLSWGADGLPGPDPAIDPDTPGADIDLTAAMGLKQRSTLPPLKIRVTPAPPRS